MAADEDSDGPKRPGSFRRHRGLVIAVLAVVVVTVAAVGGFALVLNNSLGNIQRVPVTIAESDRPVPNTTDALNILLLGADAGSARSPGGNSILEDAASDTWPQGKYRSDATMLVHITADRKSVFVASIPRDSYVPVYDSKGEKRETTKINAALSIYGPSGAIATVENLTDLRIDHLPTTAAPAVEVRSSIVTFLRWMRPAVLASVDSLAWVAAMYLAAALRLETVMVDRELDMTGPGKSVPLYGVLVVAG